MQRLAADTGPSRRSCGRSTGPGQRAKSLRSTEEGVRRAAVHCYAIEGQYPESVDYLEENYGLRIDHDRYLVHYDIFADNILPEITVFSLADEQGQ